jgi:hypothetical protein
MCRIRDSRALGQWGNSGGLLAMTGADFPLYEIETKNACEGVRRSCELRDWSCLSHYALNDPLFYSPSNKLMSGI